MRRFVLIPLVPALCLAASVTAAAQSASAPPETPPSAQKPPAQTPPPQTTAPAAPAADAEAPASLFTPTWRQAQIGGRFSSVSGDPARWQRYQDIRDGVLFTDARYAREDPNGSWLARVAADNVGWRDQRYFGDYERVGKFVIRGLFDSIPQFYSVETKTPYTTAGGDLVIDDAAQQQAQAGAKLNVYPAISPQFDLQERRDVGKVSFLATPTPQIDVKAEFVTQRHVGELPWGASFGFSNDVELALPYDSRANDFSLGTEWTKGRNMLRVSYDGSWFDNLDPILTWDSPLQLNDTTSAPGRGRMTLWPSNSAQTVSFAGYSKFAKNTQLTGFFSLGFWNNDEPLQPFTINAALPVVPLPRTNTDASANIVSTNLNLVTRPRPDWRFSGRLRVYDYNNETPATAIAQYVSYDTSVNSTNTGGPRLYAHSRTTFDADATWTGLAPLALTGGYTRNNGSYDFRTFDSTGEDVLRLTADAVGSQWVSFRAQYEYASRSGSGLNEDLLIQTHEQPGMRHYDIADRSRNRFTGQVDATPNDMWTFSASSGVGTDDYDDSQFGLQDSSFRTFSLSADYRSPKGFDAGVSYNYERYKGLQLSRQNSNPGEELDPLRDWTADSRETVNYFSLYLAPPKFGDTEARLSYDFGHAKGNYLYTIPPGSPLVPPNQLPEVFNKLQQLHLDVRHRLGKQLAATLSYQYEPFRVFDFAFDPTVVNGIVQPSSLVLAYTYRPYTAHSAVVGLRYFW